MASAVALKGLAESGGSLRHTPSASAKPVLRPLISISEAARGLQDRDPTVGAPVRLGSELGTPSVAGGLP
jgi:hypothetical protein